MTDASVVSTRRIGRIAVVTIDNPPVNVLSLTLRRQLGEALSALHADGALRGVVLTCAGRTFVAGADISEFGTPKQKEPPLLPALCAQIEAMPIPVVAAIHGSALGGGLELALGCHHRVVAEGARLGLPEVTLGFIPGAGGTVRLPRLIGPLAALDMIVSGAPVSADKAVELGLADRVATGSLIDEAVGFAEALNPDERYVPRPVRARDELLGATRHDPSGFDARAAQLLAKARGLSAPAACVEAVRNAFSLPFDEAIGKERERFLELSSGLESKALRHLFFAEREAAKVPGIGKRVQPRGISKVGVVGGGTMGGGIAMAFANAGFPVTILEMADEALKRGLGLIENNYSASVARGSLSGPARDERVARLAGTTDYAALADCDLIVEAVFEDMAVKKDVFGRLGQIAKSGAILATNTSYLDVNEIAAASRRPADVVGLHFFSPANVMRLLEIVRGSETAPEVIVTALSVARKIGKIPVVVGVCHGFVGNRMLAARGAENENLLLEGATPEQIDRVFTDFGWPMGPFQMGDLAGLDIGWRNRQALGKTAILADTLCGRGQFGQKTGSGWYVYAAGSRTPSHNPAVEELIATTAKERGIVRRAIADSEIRERTLLPMINEGARILEEGIVSRASDIDVVWVNGYGFPKGKGGPMFWASHQDEFDIVDRLDHWFAATGRETFRRSSALLAALDRTR
jgi:3-hydroxyacyl-CoA dehydrogenase